MTTQNTCAACGQENAPEARFCVTCGSSLQEAASPEDGAESAYGMLPARTAGDILNATLSLYLSAPWAFVGFVGISLVAQIPATIAGLTQEPVSWVLTVLGLLISIIAAGAMVHATARHVLGKEWDIGSSYTRALERVISLLVASIVYALVSSGLLIIAGIISIFSIPFIDQNTVLAIAVGGIILLLVIVGIPFLVFALVIWHFYAQAIMIEGRRNLDALSRSYELVRDNWWRVFGIGVLFLAVALGFFLVALIPIVMGRVIGNEVVGSILFSIALVLITPFLSIGGTVLYLDLRVRKENYTLDRLAAEVGE